jgi:hypothetical protein
MMLAFYGRLFAQFVKHQLVVNPIYLAGSWFYLVPDIIDMVKITFQNLQGLVSLLMTQNY